ncbi:DNA repair protein RecO [Rubrobacter aplysinae]|uniref:DNA repair protein RecO n=1 Tax=Rubrobacter aplysinae TaxID=909625 RepID=UPI00069D277B|nr:DNA repair protein RecO [Rubrobacter aplysinae]
MAPYKSRGIVLRSIRYGEADRILDLYTLDGGLVSAIAKGIRRTKSRFGARLEPLSCVEFVAYGGRNLDTVTQAETLRSFHPIRENLGRLEAAGRMARDVRALSGGDEADRRVFNLLYHALDALESKEEGFGGVEAAFGMKLAMLAGYAPEVDSCVSCSAPLEAPGDSEGLVSFSPELGGLLCGECKAVSREAFPLPPGAPERLRGLLALSMKEIPREPKFEESLLRVVHSHIQAHAPAAIQSRRAGKTPGPRVLGSA